MAIKQGDKGVDLSRYQLVTSYGNMANAGVKFGYVKATEGSASGTAYVSPVMDAEFNGLMGAGIDAGFYHFARYTSVADAQAEAEWFVSHIKNYHFTLPPALDLEYNGCGSVTVLAEATAAFLKYVEDQLGSAIIYLSAAYYGYVKSVIGNYGIWLADPSTSINIPVSEDKLFAWQQNWHGQVSGVNGEVDLDIACGNFYTVQNKFLAPAPKPVVAPTPTTAKVEVPSTYTVKGGDTVSAIAAKFNLTVAEIEKLNNINTSTDEIYVGQVLKLKATASTPPVHPVSKPVTYTVKGGDTVSAIAAKFGVSVSELESWNHIDSKTDLIVIGQVLTVKK